VWSSLTEASHYKADFKLLSERIESITEFIIIIILQLLGPI